ncbi:helix-turn-helix transcriptional regulator [Roseateles albus]
MQAFFVVLNDFSSLGNDLIKCHLSRLMGERKLKVIDVARATGLHRNTITLLYDETAVRVELEAMDKLCEFFGVEVGGLFERTADSSGVAKTGPQP